MSTGRSSYCFVLATGSNLPVVVGARQQWAVRMVACVKPGLARLHSRVTPLCGTIDPPWQDSIILGFAGRVELFVSGRGGGGWLSSRMAAAVASLPSSGGLGPSLTGNVSAWAGSYRPAGSDPKR